VAVTAVVVVATAVLVPVLPVLVLAAPACARTYQAESRAIELRYRRQRPPPA
jgi:hypothetical protein